MKTTVRITDLTSKQRHNLPGRSRAVPVPPNELGRFEHGASDPEIEPALEVRLGTLTAGTYALVRDDSTEDPDLGAVWWISRIEEVHSEPRYRIEIRMGSEWKPAVHGTWNQTSLEDEEASSVHGEREAHELLQSLANAIDVTKYITRKVEILDEEEIHDCLDEVRATGRAYVERGGLYTMPEENSAARFCGAVNRLEAEALIEAHFMCFAAGALARERK